jgi:V/A-type H+-transporting ATPase subunit A
MADVVTHFPELEDPRTGKRLIERTIMIANVSNMPVSAREASIYMGVTMAEYFRDQGYDVAIMADSTSRWAEALRDISGRLEEIPAEAGFPAYLPERIAEFYERAGRVVTLGSEYRVGSVTIMGAVSPPGGDFSEPVTSITLRFAGTLWALDTALAFRRHFPAINWLMSFSRYVELVSQWWQSYDKEWLKFKMKATAILEEASKIEEIARIIGEKALPDEQRLVLLVAEMIREGFLVQNAFHDVDTYCEPEKQAKLLRAIVEFYDLVDPLVRAGVPVEKIRGFRSIVEMMRLKERKEVEWIDKVKRQVAEEVRTLAEQYGITV